MTGLPKELKAHIILLLAQSNFDFEASIKAIKNLAQVNTKFRDLLNDPTIRQNLLPFLSKQFGIPQEQIAFALGTPQALNWLQQKYPHPTYLNLLKAIFYKFDSNLKFLNSRYFIGLVEKLSKGQFESSVNTLWHFIEGLNAPDIALSHADTARKLSFLILARLDLLTDSEIMGYRNIFELIDGLVSEQEIVLPIRLQENLRRALQIIEANESEGSERTLSGSESFGSASDYGE